MFSIVVTFIVCLILKFRDGLSAYGRMHSQLSALYKIFYNSYMVCHHNLSLRNVLHYISVKLHVLNKAPFLHFQSILCQLNDKSCGSGTYDR